MQTAIIMQLKFYELFFFSIKTDFQFFLVQGKKIIFQIQAYGFFFIFMSHLIEDRHDVIQLFTLRC